MVGKCMEEKQKTKTPFSIKLCSDKAAFEVRLLRKTSLKMDEAKQSLEKVEGHEVMVCTPHILILRCGGAEVTLSKNGRMLIKRVKDEKEAALVAEDVLRVALKVAI